MIFYAIIILLIIILRNYAHNAVDSDMYVAREERYRWIVFAILVFAAAFHVPDVGSDADDYMQAYRFMKEIPFANIFTDRSYENYSGYYALSKVFSLLGMPVQVWFGFVEAFYLYAIMLLIDRFSSDKLLSLLLFVTLGLFGFSVAGMKQTMGMGAMLYAFLLLCDRRFFLAILFVAYGYFCHGASLTFLPALVLLFFVDKKYYYLLVIAASVLFLTSYSALFTTAIEQTGQEKFYFYLEQDNRYSAVMLIFYLLLFAYAIVGYKIFAESSIHEARLFMGMLILALTLQIFATSYSFMFRLSIQYALFYLFMIPNSLKMLDGDFQKQATNSLIFIASFYCIYTNRLFDYQIGIL